jgi:hypothetical protein
MKNIFIIFCIVLSLQAESTECENLYHNKNLVIKKYKNKIKGAISAVDEITYSNLMIKEINKYISDCYQTTNNSNLKELLKKAYDTYEEMYAIGKRGLLLRGSTVTDYADDIKNGNILSGLFSAALNTNKIERLNKKYKQTFLKGNEYLGKAIFIINKE